MSNDQEITLRGALNESKMVKVIEVSSSEFHVEALCRMVPGQDANWLKAAERMLVVADIMEVKAHICRRYVLKEGKLAFGIHVSFDVSASEKGWEDLPHVLVELGQPETLEEDLISTPRKPTKDAIRSMTSASPRAPSMPVPVALPPAGFKTSIKLVESGRDSNGRQRTVEEMPIPNLHVTDMNRPNKKGRGAKGTGS